MDHAIAVSDVRVWWRAVNPPPSLGRRLDLIYTTVIVTAIFGTMAYGTASAALAQVVSPDWLTTYGPSLALAALVVTAHWGAYQGPVVFTPADVAWLLGAPLSRRGLSVRRLAVALAAGAAVGAVVGAVLLVGLGGEGRGVDAAQVVGVTVGAAELGALGVVAAWAVERSARVERVLSLATWPLVVAAALLAVLGVTDVLASLASVVVLAPATVFAAVVALRRCGDCPTERHMRRAEARATAVVSLAGFDARTARQGLARAGGAADSRVARADLRRLRAAARDRPRLVVAWRDALAALRTPGRTLEAMALVAAGTGLAALVADKPAAVTAGVIVAYCGAALLLTTLRAELDVPDRTSVLLLPARGEVVFAHAFVPATLAAVAAALAAAGCVVGGADPAAAAVAFTLAPAVTACAAMSARRGGRLPISVLTGSIASDPSGGAAGVLGWFAWWPTVALAIGAAPVVAVGRSGAGAVVPAVLWVAVCTAILGGLLRRPTEPG